MIIAGGSAYPRISTSRFRAICDEVGALLLVDMAHFAGPGRGGRAPEPFGYAHVVTTTTHKTLRGPRGGMVLTDDEAIAKKINSAVFPGLQGGPLMHVIAAKAVAFREALQPEFKAYAKAVIANAKMLAGRSEGARRGPRRRRHRHPPRAGRPRPLGLTGKDADESLEHAGITCNKNGVPFDPLPPMQTSGIRVGSPAGLRAASARPSSATSPTWSPTCSTGSPNGAEGNRGRARSQRAGARAVCPVPDLPRAADALPVLRARGQPGEGQPAERGRSRDPPAPPMRGCGARFTTFERVQMRDLTVIKKTASASRSTATSSPARSAMPASATSSRPSIDQLVRRPAPDGNPRRRGHAAAIGEAVMAGLKALDHVAYIRFASIYKDFSDPGDFAEIAERVEKEAAAGPRQLAVSQPPVIVLVRPQLARISGRRRGDAQFRADRDAAGRAARRLAQPDAGPAASGADVVLEKRSCSTRSRRRSPTAQRSMPRPSAAATS